LIRKSFNQTYLPRFYASSNKINSHKLTTITSFALAFAIPSYLILGPVVPDVVLLLALPIHSGVGIGHVIEDYVPPMLRAPTRYLMYFTLIVMFFGLLKLIINGPGIIGALSILWT